MRATKDRASSAAGLADLIKTVSDLGLQSRPKPIQDRALVSRVRKRLSEWYPPTTRTAVHAPYRVRGEVAEHTVEFAVARGGRWCAVKPVQGRQMVMQAASWLGTWRDIWLGRSSEANGNGLVGAVSIYPTADVSTTEVDVVKDILGRFGSEHIPVAEESSQGVHDAIESVLRVGMLQ